MKIVDLKSGQSGVEIEGTVIEVGEVREFNRFGRTIKVATATVKDDSGQINISLWNEDINKVKKGDKIKVTNGFVKEFQNEPQLTAGKFGKIEVVGEGEVAEEAPAEEAPAEAPAEEAPEEVKEETGEEEEGEE